MGTNTNTLKTRVQLKFDTEENWNKARPKEGSNGFVPLAGELIVYTSDEAHHFSRLKVGDGSTNVTLLPFIDAGTINGEELPEAQVTTYANKDSFPVSGRQNTLYVDLETSIIYCYTPSNGYTQLSNFTYQVSTTTVSSISSWRVGALPTLTVENGTLNLRSGTLPTLTYYNTLAVKGITKEASV